MRRCWFWLLNGLLILLYLWAMGEETAVSIQVDNGRCTAIVPERQIEVECQNIGAGSQIGLYTTQPATTFRQLTRHAPLRWLAPHTAWAQLSLFAADGKPIWQQNFSQSVWQQWQTVSGGWASRWGELYGTSNQNSLLLGEATEGAFTMRGYLRRAEGSAGLLLTTPDGESGFLFVADGSKRRGTWWEWEDGRPSTPLVGIPFQKPFLQQAQSLLRLLLTGHQAALLLLGSAWLMKKLGTRRSKEETQSYTEFLHTSAFQKTAVTFLTLLTFGLTIWIASDLLARVPHVQDSLTYLFQAQTLAGGELWVAAPPLPQFFEQEFLLVQDGRWFGKYPPGFPVVLAIGVLIQAPWLVNPLLATLTVPLIYQLGRRLYNDRIGLLAAGLMTLSPFFLFLSGSHMAHAAELFWLTLFMLCWHIAIHGNKQERRVTRSFLLAFVAGIAAGMAFLTRQLTAVAITVPFMLLTTITSPFPWRSRWQKGLIWLAGLLPLAGLLFAYQAAVTGDPWQDPRLLYWSYDQLGFGEDVGESPNLVTFAPLPESAGHAVIWQTDATQPPRGHTPQRGLHNILRNWESLEDNLFGWLPLFTFSFVWLAFVVKQPALSCPTRLGLPKWPSQTDLLLLITFASLVAAEAFYWHSGIMYGPRYFYGGLPALLLLTARGAQTIAQWLDGRLGFWLTAVPLTLLILGNLIFNLPAQANGYRGFNFVVGDKLAQVETAVPPNEQVLIFVNSPAGDWWEYGELFLGNTPWLDGRIIYARDLGDVANRALQAHYPNYASYRLSNGGLDRLDYKEQIDNKR